MDLFIIGIYLVCCYYFNTFYIINCYWC